MVPVEAVESGTTEGAEETSTVIAETEDGGSASRGAEKRPQRRQKRRR